MSGELVLAARVYRDLLKAVVKHVGKEDHKAHFTEFVKQEFRNKANSEKIDLARNYTYLLNSIHSHKVKPFMILNHIGIVSNVTCCGLTKLSLLLQDLLFSYNIAVDRTEEMKRVLGKSAASVGLRLPEVYQP